MRPLPPISMIELRRIADFSWDALTATERSASGTDEYDGFLATGAAMLWNGASDEEVGDYFVDVETDRLGIDTGAGIRERAQAFARALREYLQSSSEELT